MKRIVYLLGAGFSAPLGLPTMSNFYQLSRRQFSDRHNDFSYFEDVFREVDGWGQMKGIYKTDVWNIEEILSILEMKAQIEGDHEQEERFKKYIRDVIRY